MCAVLMTCLINYMHGKTTMNSEMIKFKQKEYRKISDLSSGACGKTILVHDVEINQDFVCKKYDPIHECYQEEFYQNFVNEIKILHLLAHKNIVRVFNYFLYPDHKTGYIIMEHVNGLNIEEYLLNHPEQINKVFLQCLDGFCHLEEYSILHRDIRPDNILVTHDGVVKIIDFGFGKQIEQTNDFAKSISLNWNSSVPNEFKDGVYAFTTDIYFLGKLFRGFIDNKSLNDFKFQKILDKMCLADYQARYGSFINIQRDISSNKFREINFNQHEIVIYRNFSDAITKVLAEIEVKSTYFNDCDMVIKKLGDVYDKSMLESVVANNSTICDCFINGAYKFHNANRHKISVEYLKQFLEFINSISVGKQHIVLNNLYFKIDSIVRYDSTWDVPF